MGSPLHPITYVPSALFQYTTASIPTFLVGGGMYWLLTTQITMRRGQGGYDLKEPVATGVIRQPRAAGRR